MTMTSAQKTQLDHASLVLFDLLRSLTPEQRTAVFADTLRDMHKLGLIEPSEITVLGDTISRQGHLLGRSLM